MTELILYDHPWAQNALKVRYLLAALDVTFERRHVPLSEPRPEWYFAVNPYGRLPTLVDGALRFAESNAILRYVAARERRSDLYPAAPQQRARVDWALDGWSTQIRPGLSALEAACLFHDRLEEGGGDWRDGDPAAIEAAMPRAEAALALLERVVADNGTFLGERTIADFSVAPVLTRTWRLPLDLGRWPRVARMRSDLAADPVLRAAAPTGWLPED